MPPVWCPGCGDFGVLQSLVRALQDLERSPRDTVIVSGIGCSGRLPYFVDSYGFHSLHGRALPAALGIKKANPQLTVVVVGGDGDGFGIGGGHVPHMARRNLNLTYIIMDNGVYALTKGHSSPTTTVGQHTPSARQGEDIRPLDPLTMLLSYRTSFVANAWSGDRPRLTELIKEAILHPGFAAVRVLSPCPTYNQLMTYDDLRGVMRRVPDDHPRGDLSAALKLHFEAPNLADGVLYQESVAPPVAASVSRDESRARFESLVQRYV